MAAASEGVKTTEKIPPKMRTGVISPQEAERKRRPTSAPETRSPAG